MASLEEQMQEIVGEESEGHKLAMRTLKDFARALQKAIGDPFVARFEPGFAICDGLQFTLKVKSEYAEDSLFRVYVPCEGFPVKHRRFGSANDIEELNDMLYNLLEEQKLRLRSVLILGKP